MDPLLPEVWKEAPKDEDLLSPEALFSRLEGWYAPDLCVAGDVMLGGRAFPVLEEEAHRLHAGHGTTFRKNRSEDNDNRG